MQAAASKQDLRLHQMTALGIGLMIEPELDEIADLNRYWHSKCVEGVIPDRSAINPRDIVRHMPYLIIADVYEGGADFRIRLFGTALTQLIGENRTGKWLSEFGGEAASPEDRARIRGRWLVMTQRAFEMREPVMLKAQMQADRNQFLTAHAFVAPLRNGASEVAQMIGAMYAVSHVTKEKWAQR